MSSTWLHEQFGRLHDRKSWVTDCKNLLFHRGGALAFFGSFTRPHEKLRLKRYDGMMTLMGAYRAITSHAALGGCIHRH